jgi:hypothetical protein
MSNNEDLKDKEKNRHDMDEVSAITQELSDTFSEVQDSVVNYAKENPLKTMGFSLLAGIIIAQLLRSRK